MIIGVFNVNLGMLGFSAADFFSQTSLSEKRLDPDQNRRFVEPGLGPNCLQKLLSDDTGRQRVKLCLFGKDSEGNSD